VDISLYFGQKQNTFNFFFWCRRVWGWVEGSPISLYFFCGVSIYFVVMKETDIETGPVIALVPKEKEKYPRELLLAEFGYDHTMINTESSNSVEQTSRSFELFREMYIRSDSPILSSSSISPASLTDNEEANKPITIRHRKLTYNEVEETTEPFSTSELEVLVHYFRAQKQMYLKIGNYVSSQNNVLVGSAILLSLFVAIFSSILIDRILVVCVNGTVTVLFSLAAYLRLDATSVLSYFLANSIGNYDSVRIEKMLMEEDPREWRELKTLVSVPIPFFISDIFPFVSDVLIFELFRVVHSLRSQSIRRLTDTKNEIEHIVTRWNRAEKKWKSGEALSSFLKTKQKEENRLVVLMGTKEELKTTIRKYNETYDHIVDLIRNEMECAEYMKGWGIFSKNPYRESHEKIVAKLHINIRKFIHSSR